MPIQEKLNDVSVIRLAPLFIVLFLVSFIAGVYYFYGVAYQSYPRGFLAGDAYEDLLRIDYIQEVGNLNTQAKVLVALQPESFTTSDSPLMYYSASWFADIFGLQTHVAVHVLMLFALLMEISVVFMLLSRINWVLAWLFLPFSIATIQLPFISGLSWGEWKAYYSFFIFFLLLVFYPIRLDWRAIFGYSIVFSSLILAYPFDGIYALVLLALSLAIGRVDRFRTKVLKFLTVGIVSSFLFVNYFIDYAASRYSPLPSAGLNYFFLNMLGFENPNNDYGAHFDMIYLGIWFWISLVGFAVTLFLLARDRKNMDRYDKKIFAVFSFVYCMYLLQPVIPRLMKFRTTWPIMISVFVGWLLYMALVALYNKASRVGADNRQNMFEYLGLIAFISLLGIFFGTYFYLTPEYDSIVSKDLYSSHMYLKANSPWNATVLVIDPFQTQDADTLLSGRNVRFISQQNFKNLSSVGYNLSAVPTTRFCDSPILLRQGFQLMEYNVSDSLCKDRPVSLCSNDYVILNMYYNSSDEWDANFPLNRDLYDTLQILLQSMLENNSFTIVNSTQTTYVLKNNRSCGSWAADEEVLQ